MYFNNKTFFPWTEGKNIDVIGFGVSNAELVFRLAAAGASVTLHDRRKAEQFRPEQLDRLREAGVILALGEDYLEHLDGEIIFRTPGLPYLTPQLTEARRRGKTVTSELEVFMELCPCPVYGITGSDGKTTTASLMADMLRAAGKTVHLGGNIGKPLLSTLDLVSENDVCVIELSSFQLLSMRCSPDVAVVTNISPNHLDVHRDMAEYVTAKRNVVLHQNGFSRAILSADSEGAAAYAGDVRGTLRWFSRRHPVENGGWMDEKGDLYHSVNGRAVSLMNRSELKLPGLHNVENFLAAASAVWGTATASQICDVGRSFAGVEHRIEFVRNKNGVRWYNDSIATSPTRTVAGLRSFDERLIVIAGGYDKHLSFDPLAPVLLERAKRLILTGQTAGQIEAAVKNAKGFAESGLVIDHASDLAEAVRTANVAARSGDVVILSPACASFDAYENFEARGRHFKELVRGL